MTITVAIFWTMLFVAFGFGMFMQWLILRDRVRDAEEVAAVSKDNAEYFARVARVRASALDEYRAAINKLRAQLDRKAAS